MTSALLTSSVGAVLGFVLAQLVNVARVVWDWRNRPILLIEEMSPILLSHTIQLECGSLVKEEFYGFIVRNKGRRIATGVRFQILNLYFKNKDENEVHGFSDVALNLATYGGSNARGSEEITLVPKAAARVGFASWRDDYFVVRPLASHDNDYYDDVTINADEYYCDVVVFDDKGHFSTKTITVRRP